MNLPSPQAHFQKTPHARAHAEYCSTETFTAAILASLLQMQNQFSESKDDFTASKRQHMIEGAQVFARILATIGDPTPKPKRTIDDNLPSYG